MQRIVPKLASPGRAVETYEDMESRSASLLPVLFQNQSAHRSSIIQSVSLHCFSFCFHIHHLASAHLVELYLFLDCSFFFPPLSLRSWLVKSFHHRVVPLTGLWAEDTCMLFCTCVLWLIIDGSVFSYLLIYSSLNRLRPPHPHSPPPPPRAQAVKIRWICNNACYVTKLDIQNRLLIVKTLDTGLRWIFCQSTNRFIIRSAVYCSMITKIVPIQIQISELRQILPKILESLPARTRVCAPI